jgi:hypothetical protein
MSDEIFEVATNFTDVAELGQGYVDRADGERILLALPRAAHEGEGVRFIVHLADGTPAFAGAGRCVQVSDQGTQAPASARYETLLDSLAFDERSRPVYEYIVAVRQMAYAQPEEGAAEVDEAVYDSEDTASASWATVSRPEVHAPPPDSVSPTSELEVIGRTPAAELGEGRLSDPGFHADPIATPRPEAPVELAPAILASVLPEPLPTGILTRPAIAAHWQPAAPRPARPSQRPHRFRYPGDTLPVPASPPRPDLDPSQWVRPAPSP